MGDNMTYYTYNFVKNYLARYRRLEDERDRLRGVSKEQQMTLDISKNAVSEIANQLTIMDETLKRMADLGDPLVPQYRSRPVKDKLTLKEWDAWMKEMTTAIIEDLTKRLNAKGTWAVSDKVWGEVVDECLKSLP